jgi:hypothetical protein
MTVDAIPRSGPSYERTATTLHLGLDPRPPIIEHPWAFHDAHMGQWTNDDDWPIVAGINEPVDSNWLLAQRRSA